MGSCFSTPAGVSSTWRAWPTFHPARSCRPKFPATVSSTCTGRGPGLLALRDGRWWPGRRGDTHDRSRVAGRHRPGADAGGLAGRATERKLRLFAVGCRRRIWHLLTDARSTRAVEVAEGFAERLVAVEELSIALRLAWEAYHACEHTWMESPGTAADAAFQARMTAAEAVGWLTQEEDPRIPSSLCQPTGADYPRRNRNG